MVQQSVITFLVANRQKGFEMNQSRRCYFIQHTVKDSEGNFIPCIAIEGEKGFYKTDWEWGNDYQLAQDIADEMNEKMGINKHDSSLIVLSSML
jgi:hypothetical protein